MAKFCGKCGSELEETTNLCPNCDAKQLKKAKKNKKRQKKKSAIKRVGKIILFICLIVVITGGIFGILTHYDIVNIPMINKVFDLLGLNEENKDILESYNISAPDADSYYEENSKIVSKFDANDSEGVYTEAEAMTFFTNLKFGDYPITTEYSMDGTYYDAVDISADSTEKHPIYQTYYISENSDLWMVYLINDAIMATPVSYNMQSDLEVQVTISESDTVTSYDSVSNKFYETVPNDSALLVLTVEKIDAETLEQLTLEEIDNYVQAQK